MSDALESEQRNITAFYELLDSYTAHVIERIDKTASAPSTGTGQDTVERQAEIDHWSAQLRSARAAADRLAFGRVDLNVDGHTEIRHIGRMGLRDAEGNPVLLDWRAPTAAGFYQATALQPMGVELRRRIITRGRTVTHIDDEDLQDPVYDVTDAAAASVEAPREGRMGDIVATIAADQDSIVRSPLSQITIVEGGPGTGKTVVALHRAAWLLYTHRDQLARDGVLIVGPSGAFLHYIDQVLPSLGETDVVLLTPGQLYPAVNATQYDDAAASAIKGSTRMVRVIAAALDSIIRIPTSDVTIDLEDGSSVRITAKQLAEARRQVPKDYAFHQAREPFLEKALQHLCRYRARQRGWDERDADIRADVLADLTGDRHVRRVLNLMWMPSTPERLISRLLEDSQFLAKAANGILSPSEQRTLLAARIERPIWTVDDAALLDEAAEQLGPWDPEARQVEAQAKRERAAEVEHASQSLSSLGMGAWISADRLADRSLSSHTRLSVAERALSDRTWTYGHVIVDEAQELSPMAWHCLSRRTNRISMTVVGDLQQTTHAAGVTSWDDVFTWATGRTDLHTLTITYRITRQTAAKAAELLARFGGTPPVLQAVRDGEVPIEHSCTTDELAAYVLESIGKAEGRYAVIVPDADRDGFAALLDGPQFSAGEDALDATVAVLTARETKGLEFDIVFVIDPDAIGAQTVRGSDLYVAATRATHRLHLVTIS
jgi:DNA helicase IV